MQTDTPKIPVRPSWDDFFMATAVQVASRSRDPSTKVGAIIVGDDHDIRSTGYNGFPRGVDDTPARLSERETRLVFTVHAEVNAIVNAALHGVSTRECIMYCNMPPCAPCAGVIINAGISEIVIPSLMTVVRWQADLDIALVMFKERGVLVRTPNCKPKKYREEANDDRIREVNDSPGCCGTGCRCSEPGKRSGSGN